MKIETVTIYICDYCKKYYKAKHHAKKHEKYCYKNPNNKHKCLQGCKFLKKEDVEIENEYTTIKVGITFVCSKNDENMYTYVAERRSFTHLCDGDRMPLECDNYE